MKTQTSQKQRQNENTTQQWQSVQERAYELFQERGQQPGHELEDWLQAEQEVGGHEQRHENT